MTETHERVTLSFTPSGTEVRVPTGVTVFDAASWNGIAIDSTCGGHGTCKKCKVRIDGAAPATSLDIRAFTPEQLRDGWRLACMVKTNAPLTIEVPPLSTRPKAATVGVGRQVILRPTVQKRFVQLVEPTLHDQRSDVDRLHDALDDLDVTTELSVLRGLPKVLRAANWEVTAVVVDETVIAVEPGDTTATNLAVAVDLGTTTVVATLLDLTTGTPLAVRSGVNRQQNFGADVISRISATMFDPNAAQLLQSAAVDTINELVAEVCAEADVAVGGIYEIAIAGNATMVQLLLGVDPEPVGVAPFIPAAKKWPMLLASEVGLKLHPGARCFVFPSFGAYVGGDLVAGVLASGMDRDKRIRLLVDVGTNCEIILSDGQRILATAAPAGPAFEAASIACGMRAADGAIETASIDDGQIKLGVIGDVEPAGICGSGLVDLVFQLHKNGLLDDSGRLVTKEAAPDELAERLIELSDGARAFLLHGTPADPLVYLSQRDIRELQFAKASIATGWRILLEELGLAERDVQQVLLAGSFGSYLSPTSAIGIGLVPKLPVVRIVSAGNVAGEGAKMVLLSHTERAGAMALLDEVDYVELSDRSDFQDRFLAELSL